MPSGLEKHFLEQFKQLCNRSSKKIGVALSGGVDSMSLVHLLSECNMKYFNGYFDITALTVDHRFRKDSTAEALAIGRGLRNYNIKHEILTIDWSQDDVASSRQFEKIAREKRFQILKKYVDTNKIGQLYLGHNLDDQLETFIMRLSKNSNFPGLNCTKRREQVPLRRSTPKDTELELIRPLLKVWKKDLYDYCRSRNLEWFEDFTNVDTSLTARNRIRDLLSHPEKYNAPITLQKPYIYQTLRRIQELQGSFEASLLQLQKYLKDNQMVKIDHELMSLKLHFSRDTLNRFHPMVFHMYFYEICQTISPSDNYHYRFSSIAGNFWDPSTASIFDRLSKVDELSDEKFTLLHLSWHCKYSPASDDIVIDIKRQTPIRSNPPIVSEQIHDSNWILFDNRVWVKLTIKSDIQELRYLRLVLYSSKLKNSYNDSFPEPHIKTSMLNNLPVLVTHEDQIVGFPTLNSVATRFSPYIKIESAFK